jgi:hypothetical protein
VTKVADCLIGGVVCPGVFFYVAVGSVVLSNLFADDRTWVVEVACF